MHDCNHAATDVPTTGVVATVVVVDFAVRKILVGCPLKELMTCIGPGAEWGQSGGKKKEL